MKPEGDLNKVFAPARALAQHCAELTLNGPRPEERPQYLSSWRRDIVRELGKGLAELLAGGKVTATLSDPEFVSGAEVFDRIGPIAANCLLRCGEGGAILLLSFDFATAIALTDRSFGGAGQVPPEAPEHLPGSAGFLIDQLARVVAQSIGIASAASPNARSASDVIVCSESASRLKCFDADTKCAIFSLEFCEAELDQAPQWSGLIALEIEQLDAMLPGFAAPIEQYKNGPPSQGDQAPFASIPVPLKAVLSEFDMPLVALDQMKPGDDIALCVPREVPLRIGADVIAHGILGTAEDRMALRLTQISQRGSVS